MGDFTDWYLAQWGRLTAPTIERTLKLRAKYDSLRIETERARVAWQQEKLALALFDAALKGYTAGQRPNQWREGPGTRGSGGGKARAAKLTPERRSEIAKKGAEARWRTKL
jgi:hypothetical protein